MKFKKGKLIASGLVLFVLLLLIALTPPPLRESPDLTAPTIPLGSLDAWLAQREAASPFPLIRGTEKRIRWQQPGLRSDLVIVYLHGFSATRQETAPTMEIVADALGANLYETRLYGHGRADGALEAVHAERWLEDGIEALQIGSLIGEKIILVGTSTGATLATALADHPLMNSVSDLVFISPNFAVRDSRSEILTLPAGPIFADFLIGKTRSFPTNSEEHSMYWSSTYPTRALVEIMRLVKHARTKLPLELDVRLLMILSPNDKVVSTDAAIAAYESSVVSSKQLIEIDSSEDPMNHVLTGRILSPSNTERVAEMIVAFLNGRAPADGEPNDEK